MVVMMWKVVKAHAAKSSELVACLQEVNRKQEQQIEYITVKEKDQLMEEKRLR